MSSLRRTPGQPSPDLARSLGNLLVTSGRLARVVAAVEVHATTPDGIPPWLTAARRLLAIGASIETAAAEKVFTGSAGEHLPILGEGGIRIPADAGYITVLAQRMERQARVGRLLVPDADLLTGPVPTATAAATGAREPELVG